MKTPPILKDEVQLYVTELFENLLNSNDRLKKAESADKVRKAFEFAELHHRPKTRKVYPYLPYITHPIAVADIVVNEMGFGSTLACAALLHDVVEDCEVTIDEISMRFGKDVATIVDGVTKLKKAASTTTKSPQEENFKKFAQKMWNDKRIAYLKIADRLHNMRTMEGISENERMIKAAEVHEVYAPIAKKFGLYNIKNELEDLSFKYRQHEEYEKIEQEMLLGKEQRAAQLKKISKPISEILTKYGYEFKIKPIKKSLYDVSKNRLKEKINFEELNNYISLRIVFKPKGEFKEKQQCYLLYSTLTDLYNVNELNFQDLISNPKSNGYEGLINDVLIEGKWVEVQILTERMNEIAERGYAKNHENLHIKEIDIWIRSLGDKGPDVDAKVLMDFFLPDDHPKIMVLSDKGELYKINKGSTVLDFAFIMDPDYGIYFHYAEVNDKAVTHDYILTTGDEVKIIKSESAKPEEKWIETLTTTKSKDHLRKYFQTLKEAKIKEGKIILEYIFSKYVLDEDFYPAMYSKFGCESKEDLYIQISNKEIKEDEIKSMLNKPSTPLKNIIQIFLPEPSKTGKNIDPKGTGYVFNPRNEFVVRNTNECKFSDCCCPIPGDPAIVYYNKKNEFEIHLKSCSNASQANALNGKRTAVVKWEGEAEINFPVKINFKGGDRKGVVSEISNIISSELNINMSDLCFHVRETIFEGDIMVLIKNRASLDSLLKRLKAIKGISSVVRSL